VATSTRKSVISGIASAVSPLSPKVVLPDRMRYSLYQGARDETSD
jgi:hypothetical protein